MSTSIIKLHTLSGAGDAGPPCFILQVDDFHCLLDCGWCDNTESEYHKNVSRWARRIDAVLLSHQGLRHLGLLPYLVGSCGLKCPVYATTPVYKMGQLTLYDFYQSVYTSEDFSLFTLDDVDAAFDLVIQVSYRQTVNLPGRGRGLCITPLPSGHTLGGTIWKLVKEDTDIVYAVDFNHKKERHLNGATFDACMRPHLLILDSLNVMYSHLRRKDRDENLRQCILRSLRRGGNVLVAIDTAGRCLEVAHFLEQCWLNQDSGMMAYGLAMLSFVAFNVVDFAKSMIEWMSEKVVRTFEEQRSNPFHFRHMQLCHTLEELDAVPEPKVVVVPSFDLKYGFARQLFAEWADSDLNTVILTSRESHCAFMESGKIGLLTRLIGLAQNEPEARTGLPTSSTGTLVLPLSLSQRVPASQMDNLQSEIPRIRNAVQMDSVDMVSMTNDLDISIPLTGGASDNLPTNEHITSPSDPYSSESTQVIAGNISGVFVPSQEQVLNRSTSNFDESDIITPTSPYTLTTQSRTQADLIGSVHPSSGTRLSIAHSLNLHKKLDHIMETPPPGTTMACSQLTMGRHQPGYDIYPGIYNHAGGQFFRTAKRTQLLFPQMDKKIHWDEYGGHVDPVLFADAEKLEATTFCGVNKPKADKSHDLAVADVIPRHLLPASILQCFASKTFQLDDPEMKTHVITHHLEIPLRCELVFLDYEGRSDGEAMKRIVLGLRPLEVILVGSSLVAVHHLADYCHSVMQLSTELVHTPVGCEIVNCTKEEDIYQARMKDSLVSSLKFTKIRDYELAWVEAAVLLEDSQNSRSVSCESPTVSDVEMSENPDCRGNTSDRKANVPLLVDQLPVLSLPTGPVGTHKTVFVNEPKLSDLKQLLLTQGLVAEFVSGVLVVDNCVAIKRSEAGRLLLEGVLSRTYFDVRNILYQQFAIL